MIEFIFEEKSFWRWWHTNYLVFHPVSKCLITVGNTSKVTVWKSKGLSDESVKPPLTFDNSVNPRINYFNNSWIQIKIEKVTFTHKQTMNICIIFERNLCCNLCDQDFTLGYFLFGDVKLIKNTDPVKYRYSGYGIGFAGFLCLMVLD